MREPQPPTPAPDLVTFDRGDYELPPLGVCAICLGDVSRSANNTARISGPPPGTSLVRDLEGARVATPRGHCLDWRSGYEIPPDANLIADLVRLFGDAIRLHNAGHMPLAMVAVTAVGGTLMCAPHAAWAVDRDAKARAR